MKTSTLSLPFFVSQSILKDQGHSIKLSSSSHYMRYIVIFCERKIRLQSYMPVETLSGDIKNEKKLKMVSLNSWPVLPSSVLFGVFLGALFSVVLTSTVLGVQSATCNYPCFPRVRNQQFAQNLMSESWYLPQARKKWGFGHNLGFWHRGGEG